MRTEYEILKDFEALNYKINEYSPEDVIWLDKETRNYVIRIETDKFNLSYCKFEINKQSRLEYPVVITKEEHILLHELFELWGWVK